MSDAESELRTMMMAPAEDALSGFDRKFVRKGVRLEIPLLNRFLLRDIAPLITAYGQRLEFLSRQNDTELRIMRDAVYATRSLQDAILTLKHRNTGDTDLR